MKKIIILLIAILPLCGIYAQSSEPDDNGVSQVIDKFYDRTEQAITQLADALKVPAEHVYDVLVRQQIVEGISLLLGFLAALIFSVICSRIIINKSDEWEDAFLESPGLFMMNIGGWATVIVLLVCFIAMGIGDIINPEYGAIKEIMNLL